jgi:ribosomal protein S18 acetylase RimI-like enzyme
MDAVLYRRAFPNDVEACIALRGRTRENAYSIEQLRAIGVTLETWRLGIADGSWPGYVGIINGELIGFCFGDRASGEITVLALSPQYERKGIGKALLNLMVEELRGFGFAKLFLGCSPNPDVRSHGFYRHLGWKPTGEIDGNNDEILEYFPPSRPVATTQAPPLGAADSPSPCAFRDPASE